MKYVSYILIFVIAVVVVFLLFRQLTGPGELVEDFDLVAPSTLTKGGDGGGSEVSDSSAELNTEITSPLATGAGRQSSLERRGEEEIMITDGVKHLVPLDKIRGGGPPKDGIPSIDEPKFVSVAEAEGFLDDDKLGIAVEKNGKWRFYPFQILVWHEIVNDEFDGENILVTYCPLCQTGIVFEPTVEGEGVEFGTSGRLFNSNLVMYDRKTDTLWSQQGGRAIVGKLTGARLKVRAADNVFWGEFRKAHPEAEVLSQETGAIRDYTRDPYGDYYTTAGTFFPVENEDDRLFQKAITYGLDIDGQTKAFAEEAIKRDGIVNDSLAGTDLVIVIEPATQAIRFFDRTTNGRTLTFELRDGKLLDTTTGSEWDFAGQAISGELAGAQLERVNPEFGFWFAWVAFNPGTELYN